MLISGFDLDGYIVPVLYDVVWFNILCGVAPRNLMVILTLDMNMQTPNTTISPSPFSSHPPLPPISDETPP
ncbi:hypothetical protein QVD17_30176 [Tagetes erecta]|uniref:Uncharacterized protein n=1 Tax=Tagetes erecta TaxID=13708 RepID=A0AAD8K558_TARER|nr:hypothetical protein QVD17_30176 [Tagetes erecta]